MKVPATKPFFFLKDQKFILNNFKKILSGTSFLSMGNFGKKFEEKFAKYIGTKYAITCNSGTSALELICRSLNISGKEIIVPSNTFIASTNAILNSGCKPVFADCAKDMCIDIESIKKKITKRTSAVMVVHIGGIISKDIYKIKKLCEKKNIYLIEDSAQAHGSSLYGKKAGSFGIASGFSFFSTKVMTTGEGGMVTTSNKTILGKIRSMREFGKVKKGIYTNYHTSIGYNWRLGEVNSLMGLMQLKNIKKFINWRRKIAKIYDIELSNIKNIDIIKPLNTSEHNYFKYIILLKNKNRELVHKNLLKNSIFPSGYVYEIPLHKQPVFKKYNKLKLTNTEKFCSNHLCLPIYYDMKITQAKYVAKKLKEILNK